MSSVLDPTVSVVIPCYRQASYLPNAVDSLLAQSYPNLEIVVVNDGSDDDTEIIARNYGSRVRYVWKPNGGLPSARNTGIQASTGKYLLFLDADDLLHPEAITCLVKAMDGHEERLCRMGFKAFKKIEELGDAKEHVYPSSTFFPYYIHLNSGPPHAYLCSRRMAIQIGYFSELPSRGCEDWDFWLRLGLAGCNLVTIPLAGAYYRRTPGSMSNNSLEMLRSRVNVLIRLHCNLLSNPDLLQQWGRELLVAELRVRRRCIVQRVEQHYLKRLSQGIQQLSALGFRKTQSMTKRLIDNLLGVYGEYFCLESFRRFNPAMYQYYQKEIY